MSENQTNMETTNIQSQRIVNELMASRKKRMEIEQNWDNIRIAKENREAQKNPDINNVPLILRPDYGRFGDDKVAYSGEEKPFCVLYPDLGEPACENPHLRSSSTEQYMATIGRVTPHCICKSNPITKRSGKDYSRD